MAISRRRFLSHTAAGAAALAALPALAACGPSPAGTPAAPEVKFGDPVSVTFWHTQTGANEKALTDLVTKFNSTNGKNITLKSEYQGSYTQVFQKIMAGIQAGSPPDVAVAYESMVAEYMKANAVVDLDDYALKGPQAFTKESLNDIFPQYIEANKYDDFNGKLLSFPFTKSLAVNYYNEDILKGAGVTKLGGWTFDEFKKLVAATTKQSGGQTSVYGSFITVDTSYIDAFIYSNGGELLNKDKTKVRFNEPPGVEVFDMWGQMAKDGQAYTSKGFDYQSDFGQGKVANVQSSSTSYTYMRDATNDGAKNKWGIGLIPQKDPAKPVTVMFGGNVAVFRTTPIKQAASWEWVKYFTDKDQTVDWAIKSSYMPLRKSAADAPAMKQLWQTDPQAKQAFDLTQYAQPEPNITAWQDIRDVLQNALTAVITAKATGKAALDDAANQANKLIDEKR
jgi:ABC-type glycerol-3-phosphate transport system substrate-binding protein